MDAKRLVSLSILTLLTFCSGNMPGAYAATPLITCTGGGRALQSTANPPTYSCANVTTGTVTTTGSPANGNLTKFSGASSITNGDLTGDITTSGTLATTLPTVNSNAGTFGSSTQVPNFTVNAKGLITAAGAGALTSLNGVAYPASPSANTVPVVTGANSITYEKLPYNAGGTNSVNVSPCFTSSGNVFSLTQPTNPQSGTSYTIAATDNCNNIIFSNPASVAVSLPAATTAGFTAGFSTNVQNNGAGLVTITPTPPSLINGLSAFPVAQNKGCQLTSDSTNFQISNCTAAKTSQTINPADLVPVCIRGNLPSDQALTGGTAPQIRSRFVYYCPNGASAIALMYSGVWVNGAVETDYVDPVPLTAGIEVPAGTITNIRAITCNGQRPCTLKTQMSVAGVVATQGDLITDITPVNIAAGTSIAVRTYVGQGQGQKVAFGIQNDYTLGESCTSLSSIGDNTLSGSVPSAHQSACYSPSVIMGIPLQGGTSVAIAGDSIGSGFSQQGLVSSLTISTPGSGYVSGDIGAICTVPGGTAAIAARVVITGVSAGAVTSAEVYEQGSYNVGNTPTSPQTPASCGTTGSGFAITFNTGGAYDFGDAFGDKGYVARAIGPTIPFAQFTRGSDSVAGWLSRWYSRRDQIIKSGAKNVIWELGINDISSGTSAATLEANAQIIWSDLAAAGIRVYATTLPPFSTSTDNWVTLVNQTTNSHNAQRVQYNDDLRANFASLGLAGYFEIADTVESSRDSGLWAVNGSIGFRTPDGLHLTKTGYIQAATGINPALLH